MKHTKPNTLLEPLIYHHYPENNKLCIVNCLISYIRMRIKSVGVEVKDPIISFGKSCINQFHKTQF